MLHKWIAIIKCSDVEPGEVVREATDPHADPYDAPHQELIVHEVMEERITFTDGSYIAEDQLHSGRYWHQFRQSPW